MRGSAETIVDGLFIFANGAALFVSVVMLTLHVVRGKYNTNFAIWLFCVVVSAVAVWFLLFLSLPSLAQERSSEWERGWCVGYGDARDAVEHNRDHLREMLLGKDSPRETNEEALKRLRDNARPLSNVVTTSQLLLDSVDLYVVPMKMGKCTSTR